MKGQLVCCGPSRGGLLHAHRYDAAPYERQFRGASVSAIAEHLIEPLKGAAPGGRDMTYDPARLEMEEAFTPAFDEASAGGPQNWLRIVQTIRDQAEETRDFWLASYLARAGARLGSLEIVGEGLAMMIGLIDRCWDIAHPDLADYGFEGRRAPCEVLARPGEFVLPLLHGVNIDHPRYGRKSMAALRDAIRNPDGPSPYGMVDSTGRFEETLSAIERVAADVHEIEDRLMRLDDTLYPSLQGAYGPLDDAVREFRETLSGEAPAESITRSFSPATASATPNPVSGIRGPVSSREDVATALLAVIAFYERNEPASPIPILLRRCLSWIDKDFLSVLRDLAPGTVAEVEQLLGGAPAAEAADGEQ